MHLIRYPEYLFRVIRAYDVVPETGFQCGNHAARLTFEQHIRKGFNNKVKSQFISTTKSSSTAISWTINEKSAFAIISCRALNQNIHVYDLSGDCSRTLTPWANKISTRHQEVLLTPHINEEAIVGIVPYSRHESQHAMYSCIRHLLSLVCGYCCRRGHDVDKVGYCKLLEMDNAVDVYYSTHCGYCGEPGHDIDRGDRCEELEVDNAVDDYYSNRCGYCGESEHDVDGGDR
ncbi:hypothetical protein K457DRAFT_26133 [Linnemannia elongata AG-77]|uniref:DUF7587 domain-containing protein n=1 Tax=Linnemannia elongata AG-77 TaxID=1314771 RepID=A0A197JD31_9FUNG|nr:hypothetical protein K457DRAFT_26133 [Linnemannia elongata AG-77]